MIVTGYLRTKFFYLRGLTGVALPILAYGPHSSFLHIILLVRLAGLHSQALAVAISAEMLSLPQLLEINFPNTVTM
ncbi:hypothetical protein MCEGE11_00101 [Sphingomonadaceae bacterium]